MSLNPVVQCCEIACISVWCICVEDTLSRMKCPSLYLFIGFNWMPACFLVPLVGIFFLIHLLQGRACLLYSCVSCRQQINGLCFLSHSVSLCQLIGELTPLYLNFLLKFVCCSHCVVNLWCCALRDILF